MLYINTNSGKYSKVFNAFSVLLTMQTAYDFIIDFCGIILSFTKNEIWRAKTLIIISKFNFLTPVLL